MMISLFMISCKKEYQRPDHFSVDLFKNEKNEQQKKIWSSEDAMEKSLLVIKSIKTELISSANANNKPIYIYKVSSGKVLKGSKDIIFPFRIISDHDLKIKLTNDSITIYLIAPKSYRLFLKDLNVQYQTLPSSPSH